MGGCKAASPPHTEHREKRAWHRRTIDRLLPAPARPRQSQVRWSEGDGTHTVSYVG